MPRGREAQRDQGLRAPSGRNEVEPTTPAGYFNYFIERGSVFEDARSKAEALFRWLKNGKIGQKP